jgi:hypothetical protein
MMTITRLWAMPSRDTFKIKPIQELLDKYVPGDGLGWIDPFAGNNSPAGITNDLNPNTLAQSHLDACEFLKKLEFWIYDGALLDPPYSPRQVSECYKSFGKTVTARDTSSEPLARVKDEIAMRIKPNGYCISFGWNSCGLGINRGFNIIEILLVCHGGGHNDTICVVEKRHGRYTGEVCANSAPENACKTKGGRR